MAQDLLEEKGRLEREYASDIAALTSALEEEQEHRASLEERLESLDETNDEIIAKVIKDKELFIAKYKLMKKEKAEFVAANVRLQGEFEQLDKAHKALESEHSLLLKSHEQQQTPLTISNAASTSSPTCDHANIIEENARLKDELAKVSSPQKDKPLYEVMKEQKIQVGKEGLGYVAKKKKKNKSKKKAKPSQEKKNDTSSGEAARGNSTRSDFAGPTNPNYILYTDYYGDIYAKYVGPYDGFIAYSIWVPKTLVTDQRGPIAKWVPKTKQ